ncbi:MAG: hypothetical protein ACR2OL_21020 [Anderseniella sp.]
MKTLRMVGAVVVMMAMASGTPAHSQTTPPAAPKPKAAVEGTMTTKRMGEIIKRLDPKAKAAANANAWQFHVEEVPVVVVTDAGNNRMRIMIALKKAETMSAEELLRLSQANFDTALDARYAIAKGLLWATFIHPLSELHDKQFIAGIGQTVNAAKSYGTTYSSGLLSFGGGDSRGIIQRDLIDKLIKKGQEI